MKTRVPLVQIDIGLLADQVGVSATDTLDLGQGVHNLLLSINVGVQKTENLDETMTVSPEPLLSCFLFHPLPVRRKSISNALEIFVRCDDDIDTPRKFRSSWKRFVRDELEITYELKVRLLSRDERHAGQLYGTLPCCSLESIVRVEEKRAEDFPGLAKHGGIFGPCGGTK